MHEERVKGNQTTVIIEGPNLVGKSFIIDQLREQGILTYKGLNSYEPEIIKRYGLNKVFYTDMYVTDFLRQSELSIVFDRSPLSGIVYNKLPRQCFDDWLKLLPNPKIFILTAPDGLLCERFQQNVPHMIERGIDFPTLCSINARYEKISKKWDLPCEIIPVEIEGPEDSEKVMKEIMEIMINAYYEEE